MSKRCPCGSSQMFSHCCGQYLSRESLPPTAEALMRSRYTAFSTGNVDYIIATQRSPDSQMSDRTSLQASLKQSVNSTQWTNLIVVSTRKGKARDKTGTVEFVAAYRAKPLPTIGLIVGALGQIEQQIEQMHERSHFIQAEGQWLYTKGDRLPPHQPKRFDPCWCGSGRKFKQCHG